MTHCCAILYAFPGLKSTIDGCILVGVTRQLYSPRLLVLIDFHKIVKTLKSVLLLMSDLKKIAILFNIFYKVLISYINTWTIKKILKHLIFQDKTLPDNFSRNTLV